MAEVTTRGRDDDLIAAIATAVDRGTRWMLAHLQPSGEPTQGPDHAYRVPYSLLLAGRYADAARVLGWMEREVLTTDGDLAQGPMRQGFTQRWSSYPLALIGLAAWRLERYTIASEICATLHRFQDPRHGGAYAERPEVRTSGRQDLFPTAQLGITGLAVGDKSLADGAYRWISMLHHLQPELPERLYTATDGDALITHLDDPDERWGTCTELHKPRQAFYNPGIAAAFLARYAALHPDQEAATLAAEYLELTVQGTEAQFDYTESIQVCKFGWGAASLLDLTGEIQYRAHAERMARWFIDSQQDDGHWDNSPFLMPNGPTVGTALEVTAEFVQHLVTIGATLAGANSS